MKEPNKNDIEENKKIEVEINKNLIIRNIGRFSKEFESIKELQAFNSQEEADEYYIKQKDIDLEAFCEFINSNEYFKPDYSPESLKKIELKYFELYEKGKFVDNSITRELFEKLMSLYWGEVMVRNSEYKWEAHKHFLTNNTYYLSIMKENTSIGIPRFKDLYSKKNNKRKQLIFREYIFWSK